MNHMGKLFMEESCGIPDSRSITRDIPTVGSEATEGRASEASCPQSGRPYRRSGASCPQSGCAEQREGKKHSENTMYIGMPGSGKSTKLIDIAKNDDVILCFTNKACDNLRKKVKIRVTSIYKHLKAISTQKLEAYWKALS